ncbi:unnamed protein product [Onchocerca ochengi]|uniref:CULT domain-containing protein n=1 Tax=Onchocerca ochengi TaxID=42157 RepID=A0A182EGN9_ONCOC|nr:unnamed protein product [Onchocerca ochengi]
MCRVDVANRVVRFFKGITVPVALLCRNCGHEIVEGSTLTNEKSVKALRSYNMTILGRNQLVQVFENAVPEKFDVITASAAELKLAGKSYRADTWWPNYEWTVCVCPSCGFHLGCTQEHFLKYDGKIPLTNPTECGTLIETLPRD